jgi:hypothetical protein
LGKLIGTYQLSQEVLNKETSRDWVHILPKLVKTINKHYVKEPHIIDAIKEPPRASGDSRNILDVGTKVRVQLDNPIGYVEGKKLHGKFRASDIRWKPKVGTITRFFIDPGQPPMYQVDNNDNVAYTKNQLQVVSKDEKLPSEKILHKFIIEKIIKKVKLKNKIYFEIKWANHEKTTIEPRTTLIKDVPDLVKEFEQK